MMSSPCDAVASLPGMHSLGSFCAHRFGLADISHIGVQVPIAYLPVPP